jgi:hypothetical protein
METIERKRKKPKRKCKPAWDEAILAWILAIDLFECGLN